MILDFMAEYFCDFWLRRSLRMRNLARDRDASTNSPVCDRSEAYWASGRDVSHAGRRLKLRGLRPEHRLARRLLRDLVGAAFAIELRLELARDHGQRPLPGGHRDRTDAWRAMTGPGCEFIAQRLSNGVCDSIRLSVVRNAGASGRPGVRRTRSVLENGRVRTWSSQACRRLSGHRRAVVRRAFADWSKRGRESTPRSSTASPAETKPARLRSPHLSGIPSNPPSYPSARYIGHGSQRPSAG